MTVTLELPPDLEAELFERAAQRGQALSDYLLVLAEADVLGKYELSEEEHQAEIALIQERIQNRLSGTKVFCWRIIGQAFLQSVRPALVSSQPSSQ